VGKARSSPQPTQLIKDGVNCSGGLVIGERQKTTDWKGHGLLQTNPTGDCASEAGRNGIEEFLTLGEKRKRGIRTRLRLIAVQVRGWRPEVAQGRRFLVLKMDKNVSGGAEWHSVARSAHVQ